MKIPDMYFPEDSYKDIEYCVVSISRPSFSYCRIFGTLPINRVRGSLHITGKGQGINFFASQPETLNFTHQVSELSFGDFYPYFDNPLDMTYKVTHENKHTFQYKLDVVPTQYEKQKHIHKYGAY